VPAEEAVTDTEPGPLRTAEVDEPTVRVAVPPAPPVTVSVTTVPAPRDALLVVDIHVDPEKNEPEGSVPVVQPWASAD
jgi:hypothetical protein